MKISSSFLALTLVTLGNLISARLPETLIPLKRKALPNADDKCYMRDRGSAPCDIQSCKDEGGYCGTNLRGYCQLEKAVADPDIGWVPVRLDENSYCEPCTCWKRA